MGSLSGKHKHRLLKAAHEQIAKEIDELAGSVEGVLGETRDDELGNQLRERFEQGKSSGKFPLLSGYLSDFRGEEKEEFFRAGWWQRILMSVREPPKEPWDYSSYKGNEDMYTEYLYREYLYQGVAHAVITDLRSFAQGWLKELARVGYYGVSGPSRLPLKQRIDDSAISRPPTAPYGEAYPVIFENTRQVLWLQLDGKRPIGREYREVRILDEPLRTDKAILAALTALEGRLMDIERLRKALYELKLPSEGSIHDEVYLKPIEKHLDLQSHPFLDYVLLLLRYHRPGFDDLPHQEKSELIVNACNHANGFLEALHKFVAFLEYGIPGRPLKSAVRDADRDVKAAVLRDVDGLTYRKIGEELGVPTPEDYDYKGDHPVVRQMVKRGQRLLERALGEGGWQEHIEKMKAEAQRRHSLSKVERYTEDWAEALRIPYEEALQLAQKDVQAEEAHIEKLRNSKNRPEKD